MQENLPEDIVAEAFGDDQIALFKYQEFIRQANAYQRRLYLHNNRAISKATADKHRENVATSSNSSVKILGLFFPTAHADELTEEKDERLEGIKQLYAYEDLDIEAYLYRKQAEFLLQHTTIAKSRENFDPGNVVAENSVSVGLPPTSRSATAAFDLLRLGFKGINFGLTTFVKKETSLNPLEILSSSGVDSSASVSNHFGINVAQVRSKFLDVDLDILTCNSSVGVNKLKKLII